jgi:uncharacterized protein (TIGR03382 family)
VVSVVLSSASAQASVVWRGDYETGDWSQWSKAQLVSDDRLQVVTSPVTQGRYALKVTVRQGDNPIGASGNRNELVYLSYEPEGSERWYRWQTMWPADYPSDAPWQIFTQWHHSGSDGSPPMVFSVRGETVRMLANTEVVWTTPLARGLWHDFLFHVKWSPDASVGFVELWYDGVLALPKTFTSTQFAGQTNYLKQGLYRDDTIASTASLFHDGMVVGTTRADVEPAAPAGADAGTPMAAADAGSPAEPAGTDAQVAPGPGPDAATAVEVPGTDATLPAGADATATVTPPPPAAIGSDAGLGQTSLPQGVEETAGCSSVPGGAFASLAVAALGVLLRRRRQR